MTRRRAGPAAQSAGAAIVPFVVAPSLVTGRANHREAPLSDDEVEALVFAERACGVRRRVGLLGRRDLGQRRDVDGGGGVEAGRRSASSMTCGAGWRRES